MRSKYSKDYLQSVSHAVTFASHPAHFIFEYLSAFFFCKTKPLLEKPHIEVADEEQFWKIGSKSCFSTVSLKGFNLTDWFPRAPGVYWSQNAESARRSVWGRASQFDPQLGDYFSPNSKENLIERGGIGTIRLRPRNVDGKHSWFASALKGNLCHSGIPLLIPDHILREASVEWGENVNIEGRVRFLQDAGLDDTASSVHHAQPLIVFVDKLYGIAKRSPIEPITITPVALFDFEQIGDKTLESRPGYTFVQCAAGLTSELNAAGEWIEKYVKKYRGRIITNFDEQLPLLAGAPLSYQRLVDETYDKTVIKQYGGTIQAERVEHLIQEIKINQKSGTINMKNNINVRGSAIININSTLRNVTQTIGAANGLDSAQKKQLAGLVESLKKELTILSTNHADEAQEISAALDKAVTNASKPAQERKTSILNVSAKGLKEAANLVKDIAPTLLTTAHSIADFITDL